MELKQKLVQDFQARRLAMGRFHTESDCLSETFSKYKKELHNLGNDALPMLKEVIEEVHGFEPVEYDLNNFEDEL